MKKFFTAMIMAGTTLAGSAQELVFDLTSKSSFDLCTQQTLKYDERTTPVWSFSSYSGVSMYQYQVTNGYYDDYLITPDLELQAGNQYVIHLRPSCYNSNNVDMATVKIWLGQGDDLTAYKELDTFAKLPYDNYSYPAPAYDVKFLVPESGNYRVAFEGFPYGVKLQETKIYNYGESTEPAAPADFKVTPDPDGALKVEVSFTVPGTTLTGQALASPAYNLYRGVQKIKNGIAVTAGEKVVYTENRGEAGMVNYSVEIISGDLVSEKISAETYVGLETATPPTNVKMSLVDDKYVVTWDAPVVGTHGIALNPDKLTYTVTRILDGEEVQVAKDIAGTSFADAFEVEGLHKVKYSVSAKYTGQVKATEAVESEEITIGSISLPFTDSFANLTMNPLWENKISLGTNTAPMYFWQPILTPDRGVYGEPYDGDGGMCYYYSYNIQRNNGCRLATPPVKFNEGDNPVLSFARYQLKQNALDELRVQISLDYGEWQNIDGAFWTAGGNAEGNGWNVENISLADLIPAGTKVYQVAFNAVSQYGQSLFIDAVRLFNQMEKDLEIDGFSVSEVAHAGKTLEIEVKIANNGSTDVKASDYSVEIEHSYTNDIVIENLEDIPSLGNAVYRLSLPVSSLHIHEAEGFEFTAKVNYAGDQVPGNNVSETLVATTAYSNGTSASELRGTKDIDGNITLEWNAAKDLTYVPVNIYESFEDESFADDSTGPFNGWVTIDLDGKGGSNWYTANGSQFNLVLNATTPGTSGFQDGNNVLGVTLAGKTTQNDWIVSPKLNCKAGSTMDLSFLFGMKYTTSWGSTYEVELLYTTDDDYDILNPQNNFTEKVGSAKSSSYSDSKLPQNNKMYEVAFSGIPADAKYVALHFISYANYDVAMWVDKIQVTENDENALLGYHIYSLYGAGRLNDELISADEDKYELGINADEVATFSEERNVFVTAVYPDGEAMPSNLLDLALLPTGVENVSVDAAPADASVEYFDLQGRKVAAGKVTPGIYIIRAAGKTSKAVIR